MLISKTIKCNGLSAAPALLRIKQALTGVSEKKLPLEILLDDDCDRAQLESSLGALARHVKFVGNTRQMPVQMGVRLEPASPLR